jgi:hypothetical protein
MSAFLFLCGLIIGAFVGGLAVMVITRRAIQAEIARGLKL